MNLNRAILIERFPDLLERRELDLRNLNIVSIDPQTFQGLDNLVSINLGKNLIREILPLTFCFLPRLTHIFLNFNEITFLSNNSFSYLPQLREINLNQNNIEHIDESNIFNQLKLLIEINLNRNPIVSINNLAFHVVSKKKLNIHINQQIFHLPLPGVFSQAPTNIQPRAIDEVHRAIPEAQRPGSSVPALEFQDHEIREWRDLFLRDLPAQNRRDEVSRHMPLSRAPSVVNAYNARDEVPRSDQV